MLEHMVDTVLYFEGEQHHSFRILRAVKTDLAQRMRLGFLKCMSMDWKKSLILHRFS